MYQAGTVRFLRTAFKGKLIPSRVNPTTRTHAQHARVTGHTRAAGTTSTEPWHLSNPESENL